MKKIGVIVNDKKENAAELLSKIRQWCGKREISVKDSLSVPVEDVFRDVALVVCLGGDGTLLSAANHMRDASPPVLGVNLGALGFLTEVKQDEVFEELNAFFFSGATIEQRIMLSGTAKKDQTRQERRLIALNDMVISREGLSRILVVEVRVSGEKLTSFAGDGVIVATPTGSTAYSLSAGGAVVHPKLEAIIITPICPHASALRSIVVSAQEKISVKIQKTRGTGRALLTADGQENIEIDDSYTVEITRANNSLKLVKSSKRSYFATLRENFKFPA